MFFVDFIPFRFPGMKKCGQGFFGYCNDCWNRECNDRQGKDGPTPKKDERDAWLRNNILEPMTPSGCMCLFCFFDRLNVVR